VSYRDIAAISFQNHLLFAHPIMQSLNTECKSGLESGPWPELVTLGVILKALTLSGLVVYANDDFALIY
jgi:hypothetical protein